MSSTVSFSFNPSSIPAEHQPAFMARFFQLVTEYQIMSSGFMTPLPVSTSYPMSPPADAIPMPSEFVPVDGDDTSVPASVTGDGAVSKKPRKNPWANLTDEQKAERVAAMKRGRDAKNAARKMSGDSLDVTAPSDDAAPAPAPAPAPIADMAPAETENASVTSSTKKERKPRAPLTDEQRADRRKKLQATLNAKKATATTSSA